MGIKSIRTSYRNPWQNAHCERVIGIIKRELIDHVIPFNERHLRKLLREYVDYYNNHRTHQGIGGQTPNVKKMPPPTMMKHTKLVSKPVLSGLYHSYKKIA